MKRRQRTVRGVDDDAWEMLVDVREVSRTKTGALVSEAIRFWYENLEEDDRLDQRGSEEYDQPDAVSALLA